MAKIFLYLPAACKPKKQLFYFIKPEVRWLVQKLRWLTLFVSIGTLPTQGQNQAQVDTLMRRLAQATADSTKARIYLDLGYQWSDIDPQKARGYLDLAERYFKSVSNEKALCDVYFNTAIVYEYEQKRDSSLLFFKKCIALGQKTNNEWFLCRAYAGVGWSHLNNNAYPEAIDAYYKCIALAEKTKNFSSWGDAQAKLGNLYVQMGQYNDGLSSYRKALEKYAIIADSANMALVLGSLGYTYRRAERYDSAIYYLDTAITAFTHLKYLTMIPVAHTEKGMAYLQSGRPKLAVPAFYQALEFHKQTPYIKHQDALHIYLGKALLQLNALEAAKNHIDTGLNIAINTDDLELKRDGFEVTYQYFEKIQRYDLALKYKLLHEAVKDTLDQRQQKNVLRQLSTKYDFEKQQRLVEQTQFALRQRNWTIAGLGVVFVFLAMLGYSYYRRFRLKKEKELAQQVLKQQDLATKAVMEAEENERRRIASELHDGVGQLMSAAKMNMSAFEADFEPGEAARKLRFEKIVSLLDESCREVRTVSHSMMPNALLKRGLASAITEFIEKLDQRVMKVQLHTTGLEGRLDANTETLLYRMVQEAVNNVIKHSGASRLDLAITCDQDGISLTIEDNGRGFDPALNSEGLGIRNLKSRVAYLKGFIEWHTAPDKGTLLAIHIPPNA
jgi:two-component system, NarL family, sensor kinase